jgi:hypothetical protein
MDMMNRPTSTTGAAVRDPLPLILGITGHRDLRPEDGADLEARVRAILEDLRKRYRDTPLVLLSPLAEGADRLAARVALDCGTRLIVPLPMSQAAYERDFQTPSSVVEFRDLLCRADRSFELAWAGLGDEGTSGVSGGDRDWAYALVGAYIAHHCQILIALWDGEDSDREGGTAQVVRFKREGIPDCYTIHVKRSAEPGALACSLIEPAEFGPVYHIVTPRVGNPNPTRNISAPYSLLFPADIRGEDAMREAYNRIFARIDTFNSDWIGLAAKLTAKREAGKTDLLPDHGEGPLLLQQHLPDNVRRKPLHIWRLCHSCRGRELAGRRPIMTRKSLIFKGLHKGPLNNCCCRTTHGPRTTTVRCDRCRHGIAADMTVVTIEAGPLRNRIPPPVDLCGQRSKPVPPRWPSGSRPAATECGGRPPKPRGGQHGIHPVVLAPWGNRQSGFVRPLVGARQFGVGHLSDVSRSPLWGGTGGSGDGSEREDPGGGVLPNRASRARAGDHRHHGEQVDGPNLAKLSSGAICS